MGPKILFDPASLEPEVLSARDQEAESFEPPPTGIRRLASGAWAAVVDGRYRGEWSGPGAKRQAIQIAGTNAVIA